ncbi:circularly permuted type 2 ATP-grasp protein [Haloferula chungangensis]|uniref:Circularly permuted type 2 ATP-grasp protein n=1 Tax=Haloferula chungangensis TaxID=1048331 RepID=A0ABW2L761_9BACT
MSPEQTQSQSQSTSIPDRLFDAYKPGIGVFDEFRDQRVGTESPWKDFAKRINAMGPGGLASSWKRGEDMLYENGIAHNLLAGETAEDIRRWNLDPLPLLISENEWASLAQGAIQRAQLWNRILHDCYGPQNLLTSGILPAQVIFSQSRYVHSLRNLPNPEKPLLSLYAVDVARDPNGNWTVIADRTETPNGTGFALENRIVLSNVFPETSKRLHLVRLASFFQEYRSTLLSLAPSAVDTPNVVLLSPGPGDKTYFEDAYLTRYLGITLAVGSDLTVRSDRLFLKTVRGLQRVHVLIRRVPDNESDPLEMPTSSHAGVPGLMQAIRSGSVAVVNPPGTSIAEAPAFLPFLPAISRHFLGEDLLLPSIETHWNQAGSNANELLNSGAAVVKSAHTRNLFPPKLTRSLTPQQLDELRLQIAKHPGDYVIQRQMPFSTAPVWNGNAIEARAVAIRLFLFAEGDSYRVMPGGLARSASGPNTLPGLSLQEDTNIKDLWVLGNPENPPKLTSNLSARVAVRRSSGTMSSRLADNMLWLGRYSERAECATRVLLEIVQTAIDDDVSDDILSIPVLLQALTKLDYLKKSDSENLPAKIDRQALLQTITTIYYKSGSKKASNFDSIPENLSRLRSLSALARDRLSSETWRIVKNLEQIGHTAPPTTLAGFRAPLQQAILLHSAFNGTIRENLTRTESWRFLNIGRRLERSSWLLTLVERTLTLYPRPPAAILDALLSIIDCSMTYRFRYKGAPQALPALDLLLFDPANPRGLAYQLADLNVNLSELPKTTDESILRPAHRTLLRALHYVQTEVLHAEDDASEAIALKNLRSFVVKLRDELPTVSEQLGWEFFTHASFTAS